jgi:uncharacterized protein (TIGR02466 family)
MNTFDVLPLFPSVVGLGFLDGNTSAVYERLKRVDYHTMDGNNTKSYASKSLSILDDELELKKLVMDAFTNFKNRVLRLETTDFEITTSWMTMTKPNGYSQFHFHKNSYYSAVVYFEEHKDGHLIFDDSHSSQQSIQPNDPVEYNLYNLESFYCTPKENLIVIFPSYLRHKVDTYTGNTNRYSLAVNFFPTGVFGKGDSSMRITHARY